MECVFEFDPVRLVLRATVKGAMLTDEGLAQIYRDITRVASGRCPCAGILDLSQVLDFHLSADIVRNLARAKPAMPEGTDRIVVAERPVMYGLGRMFESIRDSMGGNLYIVRSIEEAYELLGSHPEDFSQRVYPEEPEPERK